MRTKSSILPAALAIAGLVILATAAHGAETMDDTSDLIDTSAVLGTWARLGLYGVIFLAFCFLSCVVPDAALLVLIFSMPMIQFSGLRVALTVLQCAVIMIRTGAPWDLVPSWPLGAFLACIVASMTWALDPTESLLDESAGVVAVVLQLPLVFAARGLLHARLTTPRRMLWALTLGCVPGCVLTIRNAMAGLSWGGTGPQYYMGFIRPDIFSPMLVMSGTFLIYYLTSPGLRWLSKLWAGLLLPLLGMSLLLAGIRSGWIAVALMAVFLVLRARSLGALAAVLGVGALIGFLAFSNAGGLNFEDQFNSRVSAGSLHTGEMRMEYWELGVRGFLKRPLLGIGWACFPGFASDQTVGREPATHNIFIRILCELGLVGLGLFLFWVGTNMVRLWGRPGGDLILFLMLALLVQGFFLDHFACSYFWLLLGICDGVRANPRSWNQFRSGALGYPLPVPAG